MTVGALLTWLMVFFRATGAVLFLPTVSGRSAPIMMRIGLAACFATLLAGVVPRMSENVTYGQMAVAAGEEVLLGLALGFFSQLTFLAVEFAGRIASSEIGLSPSPGFGAPDPSSDPVTSFVSSFAVVLFFTFSGHLAVLGAFAASFKLAPAGHPLFNPAAGDAVLQATSRVIELGFRMAAPFIALNFLVNLAFSVLGRAVPRMQVFVMSFSVRALMGLTLFGAAGALIARYLYVEFSELPLRMLDLVARP